MAHWRASQSGVLAFLNEGCLTQCLYHDLCSYRLGDGCAPPPLREDCACRSALPVAICLHDDSACSFLYFCAQLRRLGSHGDYRAQSGACGVVPDHRVF